MNVIKHKINGSKVQAGDEVQTPSGPRRVDFAVYTWKGARVWVEPSKDRPREVYQASECGCFVTSED